MIPVALYFGSLGDGHFLHLPPELGAKHRSTIWPDREVSGFPWSAKLVDSGLLINRKVHDEPDGRVYWTCGGEPIWIAFFWWDRSADRRGASNSGFYVRGFEWPRRDEAFEFAKSRWPEVVKRQAFPLVLQP